MAISTYGQLKAKLTTYMFHQRFAPQYDDAIIAFESSANRRLRVLPMEHILWLTLVVPVLGPTGCDIPEDYVAWRAVNWIGRTPYIELDYVHPAYFKTTSIARDGGDPKIFTIENGTFSALPVDLTAGAFEFHYYRHIDSLVDSPDLDLADNWLLFNHPDAYLYGVLTELFALGRNTEAAQLYKARRDEVFAEIIQFYAQTTGATSPKVREATYF